jgi:hypothetical protein
LCHAGDVEINGKQVLVYKNAPRQCSACHKA